MKRKAISVVSLLFSLSLAGCGEEKHEAKAEWKWNESEHWHECVNESHDDKFDEAPHTFDDGLVTLAPTEQKEGVKTYTCTQCNYKKTTTINKLEHVHTFETGWTTNEEKHWHASSCGHDVKKSEEDHKFGSWIVETPADYGVVGKEKATCETCSYSKTRDIDALEAKENSITLKKSAVLYKIYDGKKISLSNDLFEYNGDGELICTYKEGEGKFTTTAPTKAGKYTIKASIESTKEWKTCSTTFEYEIKKKSVSATLNKEYDGGLIATGTSTEKIAGDELIITATMESKDIGANVASVSLSGKDYENYIVNEDDVEVIVSKKRLNFNDSVIEKEYDGTSAYKHSFTSEEGLIGDDKCNFTFDIYDYTGKEEYINAGTYEDLTTKNEAVDNPNYTYNNIGLSNPQGTKLTIKKKVLSDIRYMVTKKNIDGTSGTQTIRREVVGTNSKVFVNITFDRATILSNNSLTLVTGTPSGNQAKIEFDTTTEDYKNCEFAAISIGNLVLLSF